MQGNPGAESRSFEAVAQRVRATAKPMAEDPPLPRGGGRGDASSGQVATVEQFLDLALDQRLDALTLLE